MPTIIDLCDMPRSQLDEFLHRLSAMELELYIDPVSGEPYIGVPDDQFRGFYPINTKRVDRWIRGRWAEWFGSPARSGEVREVIYRLDDLAYTRGARLPAAVRQVRFGDDPLLTALNAWVPLKAGGGHFERDVAVHSALRAIAKHHPNKRAWPLTVQDMLVRIRALVTNGMLAAVGIDFAEVEYLDGTLLGFTRVPHATGPAKRPPATGAVDETDAHELSVDRREIA